MVAVVRFKSGPFTKYLKLQCDGPSGGREGLQVASASSEQSDDEVRPTFRRAGVRKRNAIGL